MSGLDGQVLYVHPYNHVQDELVPMGSVALMNAIPGPKLGLHAHELTPQHIEAATVLCLDLHWYFSVEAVHWIAAEAKRIRPDLPIVVGGITASFYAPELLARFPVDYIVQGDAEYTFPALIDSLRSRRPVPELPNLWRRGGSTPERRLVTPAEYAANDYLTFDWFPRSRPARWPCTSSIAALRSGRRWTATTRTSRSTAAACSRARAASGRISPWPSGRGR
jgi:hypothetical protein